ncbi:hypothetical protein GLAREA_07903 [Glarea lozoyensis ATCC 20868]|uniref:Uncharacterized protein n=1 Tax=Glarea lozoyensis (strain ATCC 20868 / MF5171) TaxID=1116229 RepID=S3D6N1_GLAL2|nr:uncharacterized protein GLAREA_07903 [Glarea lozoyensis ATCC 20868]EPE32769.1 hypothetical protein GLAREA_07903 [Glarea lozoyensis ATCC 20868]
MLFLEAAICLLSVTGLALAVTSPRSSEDVSIEDVKTGRVYHNVEEWMADMDEWIDMRKKDAEAEKDKIDPFSVGQPGAELIDRFLDLLTKGSYR